MENLTAWFAPADHRTDGAFCGLLATTPCCMLHWDGLTTNIFEDENVVMVELPCREETSLVLLRHKDGSCSFPDGMTPVTFWELYGRMKPRKIDLTVPAFRATARPLGFGDIDRWQNPLDVWLFDQGRQAAYVKMDTRGLCVVIPEERYQHVKFDRPFMMAFVNRNRGAILLAGAVDDVRH